MCVISGEPATSFELADELYHMYLRQHPLITPYIYQYSRNSLLINHGVEGKMFERHCSLVTFEPRFVDAVELGLRKNLGVNPEHETETDDKPKDTVPRHHSSGTIAEALESFPYGWPKEKWQKLMDEDPDADRKVKEAVLSFNRSKGQFRRYLYEGFPSDYNFITTTDDTLAMFIGFHRMVPVATARGVTKLILADKPMCLQLETLMRGF